MFSVDCGVERSWYFIAMQPAPAPHVAHLEGCDALRVELVTVSCVSRLCKNFLHVFDLHLLLSSGGFTGRHFSGGTGSSGSRRSGRSADPTCDLGFGDFIITALK